MRPTRINCSCVARLRAYAAPSNRSPPLTRTTGTGTTERSSSPRGRAGVPRGIAARVALVSAAPVVLRTVPDPGSPGDLRRATWGLDERTEAGSGPSLIEVLQSHESVGEPVDIPGWVQDAALLDAIAAAVVATDTTGKIFYFNRAGERLYGYAAEDMLGANVMQLFVEPVD